MASLDGDFTQKGRDCESLQEAFNTFLPKDFNCRVNYTHSPPKPCEPLFSPLPGSKPEKTRLASHFLTVSVPLTEQSQSIKNGNTSSGQHVLVFAMEVLIYSSKGLVTMFVSKADSTGHLPQRRPSPVKSIATTFMWWLATDQRQRTKSTGTKIVISLFARAQSQYLFPGSADHGKKHVLDDRQLIRWWARVLHPLLPTKTNPDKSQDLDLHGYMTVPGYHGIETKSFFPSKPHSAEKSHNWTPGNPLIELAEARNVPETAPPRCLLPRFPDDPKARFMQDLDDEVGLAEDAGSLALSSSPSKHKSSRWKSIADLERFWEAMEFRQECSSGRVVGFLWLVVRPPPYEKERIKVAAARSKPTFSLDRDRASSPSSIPNPTLTTANSQDSQDSQTSTTSSRKRRKHPPLTGPIIPRAPRLKGSSSSTISATSNPDSAFSSSHNGPVLSQEGYDSAMHFLLALDFSTQAAAARSTAKWVAEVARMAGRRGEEWGVECEGRNVVEVEESGGGGQVMNDLGGLVRRKRKVGDGEGGGGQDSLGVEPAAAGGGGGGAGVNFLVGRKKAKS